MIAIAITHLLWQALTCYSNHMTNVIEQDRVNEIAADGSDKRPLSLEDFLNVRVQRLASKMSLLTTREVLAESGLTLGEWRMIARLHEHGPLTLTTLSRYVGMDLGPVSRLASSAEKKGLLLRRDNPKDKRSSLFELTPKSKELHAEIWPKACSVAASFNGVFTEPELENLHSLLQRAIGHANARLLLD